MLVYEYKLKATPAQRAAMDEAIRIVQFIRNKCLRLWMDERGITGDDLQTACSRLAHAFAFAARLNAQARQAPPTAPGKRLAASMPPVVPSCRARRAIPASSMTAARSNTRPPAGSWPLTDGI